jgi:hypothetical protein
MKINLEIIETDTIIRKKILVALIPQISSYMIGVLNSIKSDLPSVIYNAITNTDEYISLLSGQLRLELGIPNAQEKIIGLLDIWTSNIDYLYKPPRIISGKIKSSLDINMIPVNFEDVLNTTYAQVQDSSGYSLPWLQWLLLDGTIPLVSNHQVIIGPSGRSRTGFAVMRQSRQNWSVPSRLAGTIGDNWITRAIEKSSDQIDALFEKAML